MKTFAKIIAEADIIAKASSKLDFPLDWARKAGAEKKPDLLLDWARKAGAEKKR